MTTFIKTKFNISDDQTNIDKYRLAANITVYNILSKIILQRIIITLFEIPIELPNQREKKIIQISPQTRKLDFCGPDNYLGKVQNRILDQIFKSKKKNYSNRSRNNEI